MLLQSEESKSCSPSSNCNSPASFGEGFEEDREPSDVTTSAEDTALPLEVINIRNKFQVLGEGNAVAALAGRQSQEGLANYAAALSKLQGASIASLNTGEAMAGQMLESIAKARAAIQLLSKSPVLEERHSRRVKNVGAQSGSTTTEGVLRDLPQNTSNATNSIPPTPEQKFTLNLELDSASSQVQGRPTHLRNPTDPLDELNLTRSTRRARRARLARLACPALPSLPNLPKEAFKSFEAFATLQSCVSNTTKQVPASDACASQQVLGDVEPTYEGMEGTLQERKAGDGCTSREVLEDVEPTHEAMEGTLQERPAGFFTSTILEQDSALSGPRTSCPAALLALSTPGGSRSQRSAGTNHAQARQMPSSILPPATPNLLAAEEHSGESEPASPSSVTGPSRLGSSPRARHRPSSVRFADEEHCGESELASPSSVTGSRRPGSSPQAGHEPSSVRFADEEHSGGSEPASPAPVTGPSRPSSSFQARHRPSGVSLPTTLNLPAAEEHSGESEPASPSSVIGPSKPSSSSQARQRPCSILVPISLNLPAAEEQCGESNQAWPSRPSSVTGPSRPGSRSKVHRGNVAAGTAIITLDLLAAEEQCGESKQAWPSRPSSVIGLSRPGSRSKAHHGNAAAGTVAMPRRQTAMPLSGRQHTSDSKNLMHGDMHLSLSPKALQQCNPLNRCSSSWCKSEQRSRNMSRSARHANHASQWLYQEW